MKQNINFDNLMQMRGKPVFDSQHEKIGSVSEIFLDDATQQPEWVGIGTGGLFGSKSHLVPVQGATIEGDGLMVPYSKDQVKKTPDISGDEVTQEQERQLYSSYGLEYSERPSPSGLSEGRQAGNPLRGGAEAPPKGRTSDSMTRSEEELRVGKREKDIGNVRLRKFVETEPVTEDVQLRRERATIEREPINEPVSGDVGMGEEEIGVELHEEEPVVEKRAVAKEQVRLGKETETHDAQVQEELRRERIEEERGSEHDPDYHGKR
jgi:uncharacterized protein (TIGR02271 family)